MSNSTPLSLRKGHKPRQKKPVSSSRRRAATTFDARTEEFFRTGDTPPPPPPPVAFEEEETLQSKDRMQPKRNLVPLVSTIIAVAAGVCLFAGVRSSRAAATPIAMPAPKVASVSLAAAPAPAPAPSPALEEPSERPPPPPPPTTTALEDREEARALLAKRDVKGAIEVATRSIEADPEDATTYLILGAAQMEALRAKDAAETFRNCIKIAKTGPVNECRAFVR